MARTDLDEAGWIPEEVNGEVLTKVYQTSAIEQVARKVNMSTNAVRVPRFSADGVSIVAKGALIPQQEAEVDSVLLEANKWADRFTIAVEDERDSVVDAINAYKLHWADNFARELDNATLGVTADATGVGTSVPFTSVYNAVADSGTLIELDDSQGDPRSLTYEDLNDAFGTLETGDYYGDLVVIAHTSFAGALRNLKDENGDRVVSDPLGAGVPTIFGHQLVFTTGARTSAEATHKPTGNPLLIVGNRQHLILGMRDGVESAVADHRWEYDERELKMRARRGFALATPEAFVVLEKVA